MFLPLFHTPTTFFLLHIYKHITVFIKWVSQYGIVNSLVKKLCKRAPVCCFVRTATKEHCMCPWVMCLCLYDNTMWVTLGKVLLWVFSCLHLFLNYGKNIKLIIFTVSKCKFSNVKHIHMLCNQSPDPFHLGKLKLYTPIKHLWLLPSSNPWQPPFTFCFYEFDCSRYLI